MSPKEYFVLRSKDIPLCLFSREKSLNPRGRLRSHLDIVEIYDTDAGLWPIELREKPTPEMLSEWVYSRVTPMGRKLLRAAGGDPDDPLFEIGKTLLLSLNDAYWVDQDDSKSEWAYVNLYENDFSPEIGSIAFSSAFGRGVRMLDRSPEYASSKGNLRKCWVIRDRKRFLLKADDALDTHDGRSQVTSERFASLVADAMGLPHVQYALENFVHTNGSRELVCSCPLFTTVDVGYIEAYRLTGADPRSLSGQDRIADIMGREAYEDMMVFDAVIGNGDRHLGNFGKLFDTNTGKLLGMAPIFDNGLSLLAGCGPDELADFSVWEQRRSGAFLDFNLALDEFLAPRHEEMLQHLESFELPQDPRIPEHTLELVSSFVRHRAAYALEKLSVSGTPTP